MRVSHQWCCVVINSQSTSVLVSLLHFTVTKCISKLIPAMSINKAQSQTMEYVGLYLPNHVFSHGQLYVALSRVRMGANFKMLCEKGQVTGRTGTFTRNVVYREIL